ncbi:MAG: hypothetical protein Q9227_009003 [Pyrenula ochraceoflavens]
MPPPQSNNREKVKIAEAVNRPLTRAYRKAQESAIDEAGSTGPGHYQSSHAPQAENPTAVKHQLPVNSQRTTRRLAVEANSPEPAVVAPKAKRPRRTQSGSKGAQNFDKDAGILDSTASESNALQNSVSVWLDSIGAPSHHSPPSPPDDQDLQGIPSVDLQTRSSSVKWEVESMNTNTTATSENPTIKAKKAKTSYKELLTFRGITDRPSQDSRIGELCFHQISFDATKPPGLDRIDSLLSILQTYVKRFTASKKSTTSEDRFKIFEALREDLENWRPTEGAHRRFPSISRQNFVLDKEHSLISSEADFQRTVMMSIIDRYDFKDLFTFSCEERWTLEDDYLLPTLGSPNRIQQPKPDLAIYFRQDAFTDSKLVAYPINLSKCLHPGANGEERWFPFFFLEAKKADDAIRRSAQERNLHSASQALFNIYQWMRGHADTEKSFFENVRIFTIALNAEDIRLRIHRAEKGEGDRLVFNFSEVVSFNQYSQVIANHLVKRVLLDYAKPHLYPALKIAFLRVVRKEMGNDHPTRKRKPPDQDPDATTYQPTAVGDETHKEEHEEDGIAAGETEASFGMKNLNMKAPKKGKSLPGKRAKTVNR